MNFNKASFEASYGNLSQLKKSDAFEVVFSGRSNVGKSSLINKLLNNKNLARVSSKPGKTGTINFYNLDGVKLVDLPGYGYAKVSIEEKKRWAELVGGYFSQERNFALIVQLVDFRHAPTKDDLDMINFLESNGFNFVVVLTKSDKINKSEREKQIERMQSIFDNKKIRYLIFSAVTGEGVEKLRKLIEESCK